MYIRNEGRMQAFIAADERSVGEAVEARDELRALVADPIDSVVKDDILQDAHEDPYYAPAAEADRLLQRLANHIGNRIVPIEVQRRRVERLFSFVHERPGGVRQPFSQMGDQIVDLDENEFPGPIPPRAHMRQFEHLGSRFSHGAIVAAEEQAESYRGCNVGSTGYFIAKNGRRVGIFSSGNIKEYSLQPKICSEMLNLHKAEMAAMKLCIGLKVYSQVVDVDDTHRIPPKAIPPCGACIRELYTNPLVTEDTRIECVGPRLEVVRFTVGKLVDTYGVTL